MPIHVLPPEIASQIAAGEVVERPASVVKELVENALDAGARSITVRVRAAGKKQVQVADDGCGIPPDEMALAVSRHATSKLFSAEDLFRVTTLGFRGEALASIASVSRLTLTSRIAQEATGVRLRVEGGVIQGKPERVGAPVGTMVEVADLFYNVPARLKFLKQDLTEQRAIDALLSRYALAYPQVRFHLEFERGVSLQTAGDGDRRAILAALYGVEVARQMLEVSAEEDNLRLDGFVSPPALTRSNRREITFFVNGRWVQDVPLATALLQAYHTLLMVGRYPLSILFLAMPPEAVDVNVHPAKAEVRFREPERLFSFVQRAVRRALLASSPVPTLPPRLLWKDSIPSSSKQDEAWQLGHDSAPVVAPSSDSARQDREEAIETVLAQSSMERLPLLRPVGQVGAAYLVAEGPDGLYLIDQHAAHERILFEKLMKQYASGQVVRQPLLQPPTVHLPPASARIVDEWLDRLHALGFEIELFGPATYRVRAVPALFAGGDATAVFRAVVEDFEEDETPLQQEIEARLAARICKRLAVRAGQVLSPEEQRALLADLEACDSPRTCPHGRPTMIYLSVALLEQQFGRRGTR